MRKGEIESCDNSGILSEKKLFVLAVSAGGRAARRRSALIFSSQINKGAPGASLPAICASAPAVRRSLLKLDALHGTNRKLDPDCSENPSPRLSLFKNPLVFVCSFDAGRPHLLTKNT